MSIQSLFEPSQFTEKEKNNYLYKELEKRKEKLIKRGYSGIEYKNKVFHTKLQIEREIKNDIMSEYVKPTIRHKQILHLHLLDHNLLHLFKTTENLQYKLPTSIKSHIDFTNHISKRNLLSTVFPKFKRFDTGGRQHCIFTPQNVGWIAKDDQGYYRYFSKSEKTGVVLGFSLLDLMEIAFEDGFKDDKQTYIKARTRLATVLNCNYREFDFENQQKAKYRNNLSIISNLDKIKETFPNLYSLIKSQLYVLTRLHTFATANIMERKHAIKKEAVFFISLTDLKDYFEESLNIKRDRSTIASAINLFTSLKLLNKIPSATIKEDETLYRIALNIRSDKIERRLINFMTIPSYNEELLAKAERIAKRLRKNKITTAKDITRNSLIRVFGIKRADEIIEPRGLMSMPTDELYQLALQNEKQNLPILN